jgi:exodeoxyribonuclease V beta subunit
MLDPGVTLVEASAGTGKTYAITQLVLRLVLDPEAGHLDAAPEAAGADGEQPDLFAPPMPTAEALPDLRKLLVVTFTKAATEELKTRIREALREALDAFEGAEPSGLVAPFVERYGATDADRSRGARRLRHALGDVGEAAVFTIHGFCKRVLERSAFESGEPFAFEFVEDAGRLKQRAARDVWHALMAEHAGLGALAFAAGWSLDRLLDHHGSATRYENTQIRPEAVPLADALARLDDAADHLAAAWDADAQLAVIAPATLKKSAEALAADARGVFQRVAAFAAGDRRHLEAVRLSTAEAVADAVSYANREPGKSVVADVADDAGFAATQQVVDAIEAVEWALVHAFVTRADARFAELKRESGLLDADDLIGRLRDALRDERTGPALAAAIREQVAVALIDEFQDTDPRQYDVFHLGLGARDGHEGQPRFFIGDPKQAIYAFRGADVFAYLDAKRDAVPERRFTLSENYRSSPALVDAVNALFGRGGERAFVYDGIPFEPVRAAAEAPGLRGVEPEAPFVWWTADDLETFRGFVSKDPARDAALEATVAEIVALLTNEDAEVWNRRREAWDRLAPEHVAVLVRTNGQARDVQDALRERGVPAVIARGSDIREAPTFEQVERVLRAVAAPGDGRTVRAALATELLGWTAHRLAEAEDADLDAVAGRLRGHRTTWRRHGVFRALTDLCGDARLDAGGETVWARVARYADAERRLTNLRHVMELLHEAERGADRSPDELLLWVRTRMDHTFSEAARTEMRLESDDQAVQVVTMHTSKGLEYPVVFAPYLWDGKETEFWPGGGFKERPPLAHAPDGGAVYDLGASDEVRALAEAERLAEALRLTYVAATRARERLYTMWGPLSGGHMSGLGGLLLGTSPAPAGGLAALDAAAKTDARERLKGGCEHLGWIQGASLDRSRPDDARDPRPRMAVVPLPGGDGRYEAAGAGRAVGDAREVSAAIRARAADRATRASFSAWAAGAPRDDHADDPPGLGAEAGRAEEERGLFAFAAGPHAGTCLHEILQHADFSDLDALDEADGEDGSARRAIRRSLLQHGLLDGKAHRAEIDAVDEVCGLIRRLARTRVAGLGLCLGELADPAGASEWRFVAPLGRTTPARLADAFEAHGDDAARDYGRVLRRLRTDEARGLFVGSADRIVNVGDADAPRWALIDWKSNHLGSTAADYGADALAEAMRRHHYLLQAHLYAAGLHRHLRVRLGAGYDYERDVAGVAYVFLRGVTGEPDAGVHVLRPSRALVDALEAELFAPLPDA